MKLSDLHKGFIKRSTMSIVENSVPIKAIKSTENPVFAIEKWTIDNDGFLTKKYLFESAQDRNRFVVSLLNYEKENGHHARMLIDTKQVFLKLKTHDVNEVTELDKAYSKYADIIRKDIAYNPEHE